MLSLSLSRCRNQLTLTHSIAFLGALIYASITYHRHCRAKSRFLRSLQCTDLFPVGTADDDEAAVIPGNSYRVSRAPGNSMKEISVPGEGTVLSYPAEVKEKDKEAVEVTVLRELGGEWEVYELPATRSFRSSRGAKSVRSLKGVR